MKHAKNTVRTEFHEGNDQRVEGEERPGGISFAIALRFDRRPSLSMIILQSLINAYISIAIESQYSEIISIISQYFLNLISTRLYRNALSSFPTDGLGFADRMRSTPRVYGMLIPDLHNGRPTCLSCQDSYT